MIIPLLLLTSTKWEVLNRLLNSLSRTLWKWCIERNIIISAQHIPGKENLVADSLCREFSSNLEWSVDNDIFNQISNMTFVPDIDLFASRLNAKTDCFVSWHPEPGAMAVDAFSISWANLFSVTLFLLLAY